MSRFDPDAYINYELLEQKLDVVKNRYHFSVIQFSLRSFSTRNCFQAEETFDSI